MPSAHASWELRNPQGMPQESCTFWKLGLASRVHRLSSLVGFGLFCGKQPVAGLLVGQAFREVNGSKWLFHEACRKGPIFGFLFSVLVLVEGDSSNPRKYEVLGPLYLEKGLFQEGSEQPLPKVFNFLWVKYGPPPKKPSKSK